MDPLKETIDQTVVQFHDNDLLDDLRKKQYGNSGPLQELSIILRSEDRG